MMNKILDFIDTLYTTIVEFLFSGPIVRLSVIIGFIFFVMAIFHFA